MTHQPTHTPTPWFADIGPRDEQPAAGLVAKHPTKPNMKMSIGILFEGYHAGEAQANAAFIVRAVNAYAPLVEAIQAVLESVYVDENGDQSPVIGGDLRKVVEQALAIAEGK